MKREYMPNWYSETKMLLKNGKMSFSDGEIAKWSRLGEVTKLAVVFLARALQSRRDINGPRAVENHIRDIMMTPTPYAAVGLGNLMIAGCEKWYDEQSFYFKQDAGNINFGDMCKRWRTNVRVKVDLSGPKEGANEARHKADQHLILMSIFDYAEKFTGQKWYSASSLIDDLAATMVLSVAGPIAFVGSKRVMAQCLLAAEDLFYYYTTPPKDGPISGSGLAFRVFNATRFSADQLPSREPNWVKQALTERVEDVPLVMKWLTRMGIEHTRNSQRELKEKQKYLELTIELMKQHKQPGTGRVLYDLEQRLKEVNDAVANDPCLGVVDLDTLRRRALEMEGADR